MSESQSDTPRTDEMAFPAIVNRFKSMLVVKHVDARLLERELAAAQAEAKKWREAYESARKAGNLSTDTAFDVATKTMARIAELNAAQARIAELEKETKYQAWALDELKTANEGWRKRVAELEIREKAIIQFCETTLGWSYFRTEMGLSETSTMTEQNAIKLRDFLKLYGGLPKQPPAPQFLERPDAPGWWWMWVVQPGYEDTPYWCLDEVIDPETHYGIYVRATPPQWTPTNEEESK